MSLPDLPTGNPAEMLAALASICTGLDLDFLLFGAYARDVHLPRRERITNDVDLAVWLPIKDKERELQIALEQNNQFEKSQEKGKDYRWYHGDMIVDVIPVGAVDIFAGDGPRGFAEVFERGYTLYDLQEGQKLKIASPAGLVLLKILAYEQNPARAKDAQDVNTLIQGYDSWLGDEFFKHYAMLADAHGDLSVPQASAFLLGQAVGGLIRSNTALSAKVSAIVKAQVSDNATSSWVVDMNRGKTEENAKVWKHFNEGLLAF